MADHLPFSVETEMPPDELRKALQVWCKIEFGSERDFETRTIPKTGEVRALWLFGTPEACVSFKEQWLQLGAFVDRGLEIQEPGPDVQILKRLLF